MATKLKDPKDPSDILDYSRDFSDVFTSGEVETPNVECDDPSITITNITNQGMVVTCYVGGGEPGSPFDLKFSVKLVDGRYAERTITVSVKDL